jgi:flavin reductase (DIM6/NTAB) family NADH-FMN oxidoreductase RutF
LLVCVNKSGLTHEKMAMAGHFCVNVLSELQDKVGKVFAGMSGKEVDRFSVGGWHEIATGSPALKDAAAVIDCRIAETLDQYTHTVFIGEVAGVDGAIGRDALLYGARRFRTLRKLISAPLESDMESLHFKPATASVPAARRPACGNKDRAIQADHRVPRRRQR